MSEYNHFTYVETLQESQVLKPRTYYGFDYLPMGESRVEEFKRAYQDSLSAQAGYSKTLNAQFIKVTCTEYYDRGGWVVLPSYLVAHAQTVGKKANPKFQYMHDHANQELEYEGLKRLISLFFTHTLPNGHIMEFIYDENHLFNNGRDLAFMFKEISHFRSSYFLHEKLQQEMNETQNTKDMAGKRLKI